MNKRELDLRMHLLRQVNQKKKLISRIFRLDEKALELFSKNTAVKRYVAIEHLREDYLNQVRDTEKSIESMACRLAEIEISKGHQLELELECIP